MAFRYLNYEGHKKLGCTPPRPKDQWVDLDRTNKMSMYKVVLNDHDDTTRSIAKSIAVLTVQTILNWRCIYLYVTVQCWRLYFLSFTKGKKLKKGLPLQISAWTQLSDTSTCPTYLFHKMEMWYWLTWSRQISQVKMVNKYHPLSNCFIQLKNKNKNHFQNTKKIYRFQKLLKTCVVGSYW